MKWDTISEGTSAGEDLGLECIVVHVCSSKLRGIIVINEKATAEVEGSN